MLINLVGNAIKFTERGEVVIRAARAGIADDRYRLRFAVSDTGIGIPADKLHRDLQPVHASRWFDHAAASAARGWV